MTPSLALVFNDDSYILDLEEESPRLVRLVGIVRHPGNRNVEPVAERFLDLAPDEKRAIIQQINRRYPGRTIKT